ncbi:co-chaperonin GroES (HSP10) [Rhodococcus ruber]|uniref:SU10 major capsid protein n=1 Tax=Rhodococcus ruber TaxID=1830 RepID=UPI001AE289E4|nr:DUF5309 family protein [Rhodococcus ruber]MBP2211090.1 co-chaperonin GroES (HSP10) [Rhodococcus ruber]
MSGVTGIGTTFNLPNYHGELFAITPSDTPLLSAIGGLTGGGATTAPAFEWQTYDLRAPGQNVALEGAAAPTAQARVRGNVSNVCQIHQERVSVSYTKQAATGKYETANVDGSGNPVVSELDWQVQQALKSVALDVNYSFINGTFANPADNTSARKTRGLIAAIETNASNKGTVLANATTATDTITVTHALNVGDKVVFTNTGAATGVVAGRAYFVVSKSTTVSFKVSETAGGTAITLGTATVDLVVPQTAALSTTDIDDLVQGVYDNGGLGNGLGTLLVNSSQKRAITAAYAAAYGKANPMAGTRDIAGVAVSTIETDFGVLNIMLDRHVPQDAIVVASLDQLRPVFLNTPGKGVFFEEALAKTGASDDVQIYGEIGLEYGNERSHGVVRGLKV